MVQYRCLGGHHVGRHLPLCLTRGLFARCASIAEQLRMVCGTSEQTAQPFTDFAELSTLAPTHTCLRSTITVFTGVRVYWCPGALLLPCCCTAAGPAALADCPGMRSAGAATVVASLTERYRRYVRYHRVLTGLPRAAAKKAGSRHTGGIWLFCTPLRLFLLGPFGATQ